jgi:hypothetical protein
MIGREQARLLFVLAALVAAALAVLAVEALPQAPKNVQAAEFQRLVGGLGFGPALDMSQCPFCFDPRLAVACQHEFSPIPGGYYFCPQHACSLLHYPPLGAAEE